MKSIFRVSRPKHWIKNFFVIAPAFFSFEFISFDQLLRTFFAFISFCLSASAIYIFNDIHDKEKDSFHPIKRFRPIASGEISIPTAYILFIFFALTAIMIPLITGTEFVLYIGIYIVLNILYTIVL